MSLSTSYSCRVIASRTSPYPIVSTLDSEYRFDGFAISIPIDSVPEFIRFAFTPPSPLVARFTRSPELDSIFKTRSMSIAYLATILFDYFLGMDSGVTTSMLSGPKIALFPIFRNDSDEVLDPQRLVDLAKPKPLRTLIAELGDVSGVVAKSALGAVRIDRLSHDLSAADIPGKRRRKTASGPLALHFQIIKNTNKVTSPLFIDVDCSTATPFRADVVQHLFAFLHIVPILRQIYAIRSFLVSQQIADCDLCLDFFRRALQVPMLQISKCCIKIHDKAERQRRACMPESGRISKEWTKLIDEHEDRLYSDHLNISRMSLLGNAVISFVLASQLMTALPNAREGVLTQLRASIMNVSYVGAIAKKLQLNSLFLTDEEDSRKMSSKTILSIFCSIFGILYRCQGVRACRDLLTRIMFDDGPEDLRRYWSGIDLNSFADTIVDDCQLDQWDGLEGLQSAMAIQWHRPALLTAALTNSTAGGKHQERLEFLGDSVLQLIVTDLLLDLQPESVEGQLTLLRTALVKNENLVRVAKKFDLENCIACGSIKNNAKYIADAVEASIGALYLDSNLGTCRDFISRFIIDDDILALKVESLLGPKNLLQERLFSLYSSSHHPIYVQSKSVNNMGPFEVEVRFDKQTLARGTGPTVKEAENDAARNALKALEDKTQ